MHTSWLISWLHLNCPIISFHLKYMRLIQQLSLARTYAMYCSKNRHKKAVDEAQLFWVSLHEVISEILTNKAHIVEIKISIQQTKIVPPKRRIRMEWVNPKSVSCRFCSQFFNNYEFSTISFEKSCRILANIGVKLIEQSPWCTQLPSQQVSS